MPKDSASSPGTGNAEEGLAEPRDTSVLHPLPRPFGADLGPWGEHHISIAVSRRGILGI